MLRFHLIFFVRRWRTNWIMEFVKNAKVTGQVKQQKIAMQNSASRILIARKNKKVRWVKVRKIPAVMKTGMKTCLKKMMPKVVRLKEMKKCPYLTICLTLYKDHSPAFRFCSLTFISMLYNFFFVQIACFFVVAVVVFCCFFLFLYQYVHQK